MDCIGYVVVIPAGVFIDSPFYYNRLPHSGSGSEIDTAARHRIAHIIVQTQRAQRNGSGPGAPPAVFG